MIGTGRAVAVLLCGAFCPIDSWPRRLLYPCRDDHGHHFLLRHSAGSTCFVYSSSARPSPTTHPCRQVHHFSISPGRSSRKKKTAVAQPSCFTHQFYFGREARVAVQPRRSSSGPAPTCCTFCRGRKSSTSFNATFKDQLKPNQAKPDKGMPPHRVKCMMYSIFIRYI